MLEGGGTLLREERFVKSAGQTGIQHILNSQFQLETDGRLLPPIEDEQLLEPVQQVAGALLHLGALGDTQFGRGAREDVEDRQLFLDHGLADVALRSSRKR